MLNDPRYFYFMFFPLAFNAFLLNSTMRTKVIAYEFLALVSLILSILALCAGRAGLTSIASNGFATVFRSLIVFCFDLEAADKYSLIQPASEYTRKETARWQHPLRTHILYTFWLLARVISIVHQETPPKPHGYASPDQVDTPLILRHLLASPKYHSSPSQVRQPIGSALR